MGKEINIGGRIYDVSVPGDKWMCNTILYRDTVTGVTSLRFVNNVALEDGTIADGQEEKLAAAYLDNWDESRDTAGVSVTLEEAAAEFLKNLEREYDVSKHAFEAGLSKYFCNPGNIDLIRSTLEEAVKKYKEGNLQNASGKP